MESKEETRPLQARFTASTDVRIVSPNGAKVMIFEAGQTQAVHRDLFGVAIAAGLVPEDPLELQLRPEPEPKKQTQEEMVAEGLLEACRTLIIRGNPKDFTLAGVPRAASVKKLVDFNFTNKDVKLAFEQAMFEVEQDGNDGKEHSEPSSSAAE